PPTMSSPRKRGPPLPCSRLKTEVPAFAGMAQRETSPLRSNLRIKITPLRVFRLDQLDIPDQEDDGRTQGGLISLVPDLRSPRCRRGLFLCRRHPHPPCHPRESGDLRYLAPD